MQKSNLQRAFQRPHLSLLVSLGLISVLAWAYKVWNKVSLSVPLLTTEVSTELGGLHFFRQWLFLLNCPKVFRASNWILAFVLSSASDNKTLMEKSLSVMSQLLIEFCLNSTKKKGNGNFVVPLQAVVRLKTILLFVLDKKKMSFTLIAGKWVTKKLSMSSCCWDPKTNRQVWFCSRWHETLVN